MLLINNGAYVVPTVLWEKWKNDQSILNMESIDKIFLVLFLNNTFIDCLFVLSKFI